MSKGHRISVIFIGILEDLFMLEHNTITLNESAKEAINSILDGGEFATAEEAVHAGLTLFKRATEKSAGIERSN